MTERIQSTIKEHNMLSGCKNIVVGLSGGADSVCLLFTLKNIIKDFYPGINITAAHVNHLLRGENAYGDEKYVVKLCKELNVSLELKREDAGVYGSERNISVEMAGREIRYSFFKEISEQLEMCKIAVAHNLDDRAETVFLNIIRGTGIGGLKGIPYVRDDIIRPLLDVTKSDIRLYCKANGLDVREDESNYETHYKRNKIRLDLIPFINNKFDVDITEKLIRLSNNAAEDDEFINLLSEPAFKKCADRDDRIIYINEFIGLHTSIQVRILQSLCDNNIERQHMDKLINFIKNGGSGKQFEIPGGIYAVKEYDRIVFRDRGNIPGKLIFEYPLDDVILKRAIYIEEISVKIICEVYDCPDNGPENKEANTKVVNSSFKQLFDYDKIKGSVIRNRRNGDIFHPYKGRGTKKLKEYFIDSKIPAGQRDEIVLLAKGSNVGWIAGVRAGGDFLPDSNTKRLLQVEIVKF